MSSPHSSHEVASPPHALEKGTGVERVTPLTSMPKLWEGPLGRDQAWEPGALHPPDSFQPAPSWAAPGQWTLTWATMAADRLCKVKMVP